jgi:thioredoxin
MKKIILIAAIGLFFIQCTQAGNKSEAKSANQQNEQTVIHIDKSQFLKEVYNYELNSNVVIYRGKKPCIVDFYADWCGPCRKLSPILEELAEEYKGKIIVYKVNSDKERQLAGDLGIQALPTLMFFPMKGKPSATTGYMPKEELKKIIDSQLLKSAK